MKTAECLPNRIRALEHVWIPLRDGTRLAARIWLPDDAERLPAPTIFEFIPYRKRDGTRGRDATMHPYFAGHGYACVRVDLRGSGDSEGVLTDEYLPQELMDGVDVIHWMSRQPWCDGKVGMIGISWGGFNGLQIAELQPEPLKAVITVCSTDDRYADDVHYMGGCLLTDNLSWASTMFAFNSLPPDPELVGDEWRSMWRRRLEGSGLWLDRWLRHQHRDAYWKHGSICEDYSRIKIPVMAVSGWADGYTNAVFRLLAALSVPRLGLVGPWSHRYPHQGVPGPAIGFLQECLRWWDHWLKGRETGITGEPMLRAWMQDSVPPTTYYWERPGRWVGESRWPSPNVQAHTLQLASGGLLPPDTPVPRTPMSIRSPLSVGLFAGKWCAYSSTPDLPHDQREEDGGALVFTSDPLERPIEILGAPQVELELTSDRPVAMVAVRLSDVAEDDKATRVTYGILNLTHHNGDECPESLEPGKTYRVCVKMNDVAQRFPTRHRIRLSLSTSYWPLAWPPPEPARLQIMAGASRMTLPVRSPRGEDEAIGFEPAVGTPAPAEQNLTAQQHTWRVIRDLAADVSTLEVVADRGSYRLDEIDAEITRRAWEWYSYQADDFASPRGETHWERGIRRGDWAVRTVTRTVLTCDTEHFYLTATLDAFEGDKRVFSENWDRRIGRDRL